MRLRSVERMWNHDCVDTVGVCVGVHRWGGGYAGTGVSVGAGYECFQARRLDMSNRRLVQALVVVVLMLSCPPTLLLTYIGIALWVVMVIRKGERW